MTMASFFRDQLLDEGPLPPADRKALVEPVFGQIKHARGFRQFLLRGVEKVRGEWALVCTRPTTS